MGSIFGPPDVWKFPGTGLSKWLDKALLEIKRADATTRLNEAQEIVKRLGRLGSHISYIYIYIYIEMYYGYTIYDICIYIYTSYIYMCIYTLYIYKYYIYIHIIYTKGHVNRRIPLIWAFQSERRIPTLMWLLGPLVYDLSSACIIVMVCVHGPTSLLWIAACNYFGFLRDWIGRCS